MPISFINSSSSGVISDTTRTPAEPTSTAENDLVVCFSTIHSEDGTWTDPADFTQLENTIAGTNITSHSYLGYKIRGADAGNGYTFSYSGTAASIRVALLTFRGIDTSIPIDVTYVKANHYADYNEDAAATAAQPITTITNNAWAVLLQYTTDSNITAGAPTGYEIQLEVEGSSRTHTVATKDVITAGLETPGAWTHTDISAAHDQLVYTIALRPDFSGIASKAHHLRQLQS